METTDIRNSEDIKLLVDTFYTKINQDLLLAPIFNDVAKIDWDTHLPRMYEFWKMILLGSRNYEGQPMAVHVQLSKMTEMGEPQFARWLSLFYQTVDELFAGANAQQAKERANTIAQTMKYKIAAGKG